MGRVLRGALVVVVVIVMVAVLSLGGLLVALTASGQPRLSGTVLPAMRQPHLAAPPWLPLPLASNVWPAT